MREIYTRHRSGCPNAPKEDARRIFDSCPIYARIEIRDPVTGDVLFRLNGSLAKHGVSTRDTAERLADRSVVQYLTGSKTPAGEQKPALTVKGAVEAYIFYKQSRGKNPETIRKLGDVLTGLERFAGDRGIHYLKDVDFDLLVRLEATWKGKRVKDPATGEHTYLAKSPHGKQKYQDVLKMFFRHWHNLGRIPANPAAALEPFHLPDPEIHVYEPRHIQEMFDAIPRLFPKIAEDVAEFLLVQFHSALRICDMVTLETAAVTEHGFAKAQVKTREGVYCELPPAALNALAKITPKSARYFFWTGKGQIETAAKDWSEKLLRVFRAASVPEGYRSHAFRDTMGTTILENGGTLEDAQIALGHKSRKTTERFYIKLTQRRTENVNKLKRKMWKSDPLYRQAQPPKDRPNPPQGQPRAQASVSRVDLSSESACRPPGG